MAWNAWLCDTRTGQNRVRVSPSAFSWERSMNAVGGGSATFLMRDAGSAVAVSKASTTPLTKTLVLDWDGFVVYAGIIWARDYSLGSGVLTLTHRDIWSVFAKRLVVTSNTAGVEKTTLRIPVLGQPAVSRETLLNRIVFEGTDAASTMFRLPIAYPAETAGGETRTYPGYSLPTVADTLQAELEANPNADVDFQPAWDSNSELTWVMRAGNLAGGVVEWNVSAPKSGAKDVSWGDDASKVANNVLAIGEGSEADMLVGSARDSASPYPAMEKVISYKQEKKVARLNELATEYLRVYGAPTEQWGMSLHAGADPGVASLKIGGTARLFVKGDPFVADGIYTSRIISFSGDLSQTVKLGFQPVGGA